MSLKLKSDVVWIAINGLFAVGFLLWSSTQWIEPELKDYPGASGGAPIVFTLIVFSLLGPLAVVNLLWTAMALRRWVIRGDRASLLTIAVTGAVWVCLVLYSASRI